MKHRTLSFLLGAAFGGSALWGVACSSSSSSSAAPPPGRDAGMDSTVTDSSFSGDMGSPDTREPSSDGEAGGAPDGPLANCSPIQGSCDIVSQNCGAQNECVAMETSDGGNYTMCSADQPSEHLDKGHACCPSGTNPCAPGLQCIGNECSPDAAAPPTGRCTPACCIYPDGGSDDSVCGTSDPEGYPGHCDLTIVDNNDNPLYSVCTYAQNCVPLHVLPCPSGNDCLVQSVSGTATCSQIFNPDGGAGLTVGEECTFSNECADDLQCLFTEAADGAEVGQCYQLCYVAGQSTPFDAGVLSNQIGYGGCPANQNCASVTGVFPNWLGICE